MVIYSSDLECVAPFRVVLQTALYLLVGLQLETDLIELFFVSLGHDPYLHRFLQTSLEKAQDIFPSDASKILLQCFFLLASE